MRRKDLEIPSSNDPLASLPREAVDDDNSLLTVVSILNASLFGAPIHVTKASLDHIEVSTRMIVVVCLILNNRNLRGIVYRCRNLPVVIGDN